MTTATPILALIPVITSQGRGSDVMIPMALPSVGGMAIELMTLFVVPILYCWMEELRVLRRARREPGPVRMDAPIDPPIEVRVDAPEEAKETP
jgi:Cu(I)/Ag(I) efflux system membrane protein CusA/SilA